MNLGFSYFEGRLDLAKVGNSAFHLGQKPMLASLPVVLASDQGTVPVSNRQASSSSVTSVVAAVSSVTVLAENRNRVGATIFNDSLATLYLKLGETASATDYSVRLNRGSYYETPYGYMGRIDGIWSDANGSAKVTEMV